MRLLIVAVVLDTRSHHIELDLAIVWIHDQLGIKLLGRTHPHVHLDAVLDLWHILNFV